MICLQTVISGDSIEYWILIIDSCFMFRIWDFFLVANEIPDKEYSLRSCLFWYDRKVIFFLCASFGIWNLGFEISCD